MKRALSGPGAALRLGGLALRRLLRSKVLWISLFFAALPPLLLLFLGVGRPDFDSWKDITETAVLLLVILPPLHLAPAVAEEIDDKTFTYLWSRPFPRWALIAGKLMALTPIVIAIVSASIAAMFLVVFADQAGPNSALLGHGVGGAAVAVFATCCACVGLGCIIPKHATATSIVYMLSVDLPIGAFPFELHNLSLSYHMRVIARTEFDGDPTISGSIIWLLGLAAVWLAVAVWRITVAEYATHK